MNAAVPYLTLPGTCAEAIAFYCDVFGAEVTVRQTLGESPLDVPAEAQGLIFNSEIRAGEFVLKASDNIDAGTTSEVVSPMSIFVTCDSATEHQRVFEALASRGDILFPLDGGFGMVIDRFRVPWMLAGPATTPDDT